METSDTRRENRHAILRTVARRKEATRQQIMEDTRLSKATVSRLVRQLVLDGSIIEGRSVMASGVGRPTEILLFRGVSDMVCGVDIGGTSTRFLLANQGARLMASWRDETPHHAEGANLADWVARHVANTCDQLGMPQPTVMVIGIPGTTEQASGVIRNAPNLPAIEGSDFTRRMAELTRGRAVVENDSNLALIGEIRAGAAAGHDNAVMITIGTGVGVGVALNRQLLTGAAGTIGEFGLMPVDLSGTTLESVVSGTGITAAAARLGLRDQSPQSILEAPPRGKRGIIQRLVSDALFNLIVTVGVAYEPSVVVLGGGVSESLDHLLPVLQARAREVLVPCPHLAASILGDPGGAVGAAARALEIVNENVGDDMSPEEDGQLDDDVSSIVAQLRQVWRDPVLGPTPLKARGKPVTSARERLDEA